MLLLKLFLSVTPPPSASSCPVGGHLVSSFSITTLKLYTSPFVLEFIVMPYPGGRTKCTGNVSADLGLAWADYPCKILIQQNVALFSCPGGWNEGQTLYRGKQAHRAEPRKIFRRSDRKYTENVRPNTLQISQGRGQDSSKGWDERVLMVSFQWGYCCGYQAKTVVWSSI